jgi:ABC-type Fe3+ transport system substrate-binding protein
MTSRMVRRFLASLTALLSLTVTIPCQAAQTRELIIVSPHWEGIQYEFGRAFEAHYLRETGTPVKVRWRDLGGGTSQIEKAIDAGFKANPDSCQIDLFFGGGIDPFESQKRKGQLQPYQLPEALLSALPHAVGGFEIVDPDYTYYGAALSSFGILENRKVIQFTKLPPVTTWEDLCQPELNGWVSSADPRKSGAVHMIYEIILQAYGWEKGWAVIYQMSGNIKSFLPASSGPTKEVATGDAAYAVSIDINGLTQQSFLGKENVLFKIPPGVSVINPDGIAILKGAPNLDVAQSFLRFVMSPAGQSLWMQPTGAPGGATKFNITRMGVLPSFYEGDMTQLLVPVNPFKIDYPFQYNSPKGSKRWSILNDLIGQSVIDVHSHLRRAWTSLCQLPPESRPQLLAEFSKPLITEDQATEYAAWWRKDPVRARRMANEWMSEAVQRYQAIEAKAKVIRPEKEKFSVVSFQSSVLETTKTRISQALPQKTDH